MELKKKEGKGTLRIKQNILANLTKLVKKWKNTRKMKVNPNSFPSFVLRTTKIYIFTFFWTDSDVMWGFK